MSGDALPNTDDPYELLGLSRDFDEKDLKRRYFALLRQFPPETHAHEFNRVQRAYEILKDPEQRARVSEGEPFEDCPEPYRSRLRAALANLKEDNVALGRTEIQTVLLERPELSDARGLLIRVLIHDEHFKEAEEHAAELVRRDPENREYLNQHALVLARLNRFSDALEVCDRVIALSDGQDFEAWSRSADMLAGLNRLDEAFRRLNQGAQKLGRPAPFCIRRISLHLRHEEPARLAKDLEMLAMHAAKVDDDEKKAIASTLESQAALYFDRNRAEDANLILRTARTISGNKRALQFPSSLTVAIDRLPEASQQWIVDESNETHIFRVNRRGIALGVVNAVVATIALCGCVFLAIEASEGLSAAGIFAGWLCLALSAFWACWAWLDLAAAVGAKHRRMVSLHPLYLLEIGPAKLVAWPLVNLSDFGGVHHHTNGIYTGTHINLKFGKRSRKVSIHGKDLADQFLQSLGGLRNRALNLMLGGLIEAEGGYDFIPHELFADSTGEWRFSGWLREQKTALTASLAVSLVLLASAIAISVSHGAEVAWAAEINKDDRAKIAQLRAASPTSAVAIATKTFEAKRSARAEAMLTEMVPDDVAKKRIHSLAAAIAESGSPKLEILLHSDKIRDPTVTLLGVNYAHDAETVLETPRAFKSAFEDALCSPARALIPEVSVVRSGKADKRVLWIDLHPFWARAPLSLNGKKMGLLALEVDYFVGGEPASFEVHLTDADVVGTRTKDTSAAVFGDQARKLLTKAGAKLAFELGLSRFHSAP